VDVLWIELFETSFSSYFSELEEVTVVECNEKVYFKLFLYIIG